MRRKSLVLGNSGYPEELQTGDSLSGQIFTLRVDGFLRQITGLEPVVLPEGAIKEIRLLREKAGTSGTTKLDINLNGTTVFTDQNNRPKFEAASGDNVKVVKIPDITEVTTGSIVTLDIDEVEQGDVETKIEVQIEM